MDGGDFGDGAEKKLAPEKLQREIDSLEDFEHLEHEVSPLIETVRGSTDVHHGPIDAKSDTSDPLQQSSSTSSTSSRSRMDSNLLDFDSGLDPQKTDEKLEKFLHDIDPTIPPAFDEKQDSIKTATEDFVTSERNMSDVFSEPLHGSDEINLLPPLTATKVETISAPEPKKEETKKEEPKKELPKKQEPAVDLPKKEEFTPSKTVEKELPTKGAQELPQKDAIGKPKPPITEAEAMFQKMGLDAWFRPERLNPRVESLIYWRDPKKSGPVFGGVLVILLSLTYFSLITVVAYLSLLTLTATLSFRIYKNVIQAVQKTGDGHPFKDYLESDVSLPKDKVKEVIEVIVAHVNAALLELRRLFLVEDLVDSIKFGVFLWCLTYVGSWFNGMTVVILAWVALFTLPKVYETNKVQIDANLDIVRTKFAEITSKVKAAIPIGKKAEEKKEQ